MLIVAMLLTAITLSMYNYQKQELVNSLEDKILITEQSITHIAENQRQALIDSAKTIAEDWGLRRAIGLNDRETIISALDNHRMRARAEGAVFFGIDGSAIGSNIDISPDLLKTKELILKDENFSKYQILRIDGIYYQLVFSEVKAPKRIGWLFMTHQLNELTEAVMQASQLNNVKIVIIDASSIPQFVITSHELKIEKQDKFFDNTILNIPSGFKHVVIDNNEIISRYSLLQKGGQIYISVFGSTNDVITTLQKFLAHMALLFILISILTLFVTYIITKGITQPLQVLLSNTKKLEKSDFSAEIDINRTDEIGDLAIAFRNMQKAVFDREKKVKDSMQELNYQATHDSLTQLFNRREFENKLSGCMQELHTKNPLSRDVLCYLDLDQFKIVNDSCGHIAGDGLLKLIANVIQDGVRKSDFVARVGGDEFCILLYDCEMDKALEITNKVRDDIENIRYMWDKKIFRISASVGIAEIDDTHGSADEILNAADTACSVAKDLGRNRVHTYSATDTQLARKRTEMSCINQIHQALEEDRFILYRQNIIPLNENSNSKAHFEVLIRMIANDGKIINPFVFLPTVERYHLATKLDKWVVSHVFELLSENAHELSNIETYNINLSGQSLSNHNMADYIIDKLIETGTPAHKICFEITETAAVTDINNAKRFIEKLKQQGCLFALDDFGSGLSSFQYLKDLPVDFVKIDGAFVKNMVTNQIDMATVKSINEIAKATGKQTVAEFVETIEIVDALKEIGVDYAQGYYFDTPKPMNEPDFEAKQASNW